MAIRNMSHNAAGIALATMLLAACAGHKDRLAGLPEHFTTKIYDNGLKQFELAYDKPGHAPDHESHPAMNGSGNGRPRRNPSPNGIEAEMVKRLEIKLKETAYCRNGYILDTEFSTLALGDLVLKGECVEGATVEDRVRFPDTH